MKLLITYLCMFLFSLHAWAATPLIYSRGEITVVPAAELPSNKTDKLAKPAPINEKAEQTAANAPRAPHKFSVEIRPEKAFVQNAGMFTQPVLSEKDGIMAVLESPGIIPVIGDNIYTPFDILFVTQQGKISQIAPSINLSELSGEITPKEPVKAFIYLQSGICKKVDIRPGDTITHDIFQKNPVILN